MGSYDGYEALRVHLSHGVAWVTIDHPPINLLDVPLFLELARVVEELEKDDRVRVIVFQSADQEFFIAHADVHWILTLPEEVGAPLTEPNPFVQLLERLRRMPKVTIGAIAGIARGGGSELLLSLDMRFAARSARLSQPEVALGIIPGGGGTQRLAQLVGRARALEIVLGCGDVDAEEASAIGYVNRVLSDDDLLAGVRTFAEKVASMSPDAIRLAKEAVDAALPDVAPGLVAEANLFQQSVALPSSRASMRAFLEAGGQTREVELRLGSRLPDMQRAPLARAQGAKR